MIKMVEDKKDEDLKFDARGFFDKMFKTRDDKLDIMRIVDWALLLILIGVILYARFVGTYNTVEIIVDSSMCNGGVGGVLSNLTNITGVV